MHYYPFNISDYRKDTMHLCHIGHGIYRALIDSYYIQESPLTSDFSTLARTHKVISKKEKTILRDVLSDFFTLTSDGYKHSGCDKVLQKIYSKSESAKIASEKGVQARARKKAELLDFKGLNTLNGEPNDNRTVIKRSSNGDLPITQYPIPITQYPVISAAKPQRKHPMPSDFILSDNFVSAAVTFWHKKNRKDLNAHEEFDNFVAHHKKNGSAFADWGAAWQTWYTNSVKFNKKPPLENQDFVEKHTEKDWAGGLQ